MIWWLLDRSRRSSRRVYVAFGGIELLTNCPCACAGFQFGFFYTSSPCNNMSDTFNGDEGKGLSETGEGASGSFRHARYAGSCSNRWACSLLLACHLHIHLCHGRHHQRHPLSINLLRQSGLDPPKGLCDMQDTYVSIVSRLCLVHHTLLRATP
jgi:hypothetical protein